MLRCAFHTCPAARWRKTLSQVSHMPGGYGTVIVKEWITTVRSSASAAAQIGSQSGSSRERSGGQIGKMPTGQLACAQRRISATDDAASRADTRMTLVNRTAHGAQYSASKRRQAWRT